MSYIKRALQANPYHARSWYYGALTLQREYKNIAEAKVYYLEALKHSNYTHSNALKDYANLLRWEFDGNFTACVCVGALVCVCVSLLDDGFHIHTYAVRVCSY